MKPFNKLFRTRNCPFCREVIPEIIRINKKIPKIKRIEIINIKDLDRFKINFYRVTIGLNIDKTPHLILGYIKNGKIIERVNIMGGYISEVLRPTLEGYFNDEMLEEYKDSYEGEIDNE